MQSHRAPGSRAVSVRGEADSEASRDRAAEQDQKSRIEPKSHLAPLLDQETALAHLNNARQMVSLLAEQLATRRWAPTDANVQEAIAAITRRLTAAALALAPVEPQPRAVICPECRIGVATESRPGVMRCVWCGEESSWLVAALGGAIKP